MERITQPNDLCIRKRQISFDCPRLIQRGSMHLDLPVWVLDFNERHEENLSIKSWPKVITKLVWLKISGSRNKKTCYFLDHVSIVATHQPIAHLVDTKSKQLSRKGL